MGFAVEGEEDLRGLQGDVGAVRVGEHDDEREPKWLERLELGRRPLHGFADGSVAHPPCARPRDTTAWPFSRCTEPSERQRLKAEQVAVPHELARVDHDNHGPVYVANLHDPNTALGPARVRSFTLPAARLRRDRHDPVNRPRRDRWALTSQGSFDSLGWLRMAWRNGASLHRTAPLAV